jgi:putative heme-binding domain-containing protein
MYREVIEHPWSIPDDIHTAVDLLHGRDKGRIWRLAPKGGPLSPLSGASQSNQSSTPSQTAQRTVRTTLLSHASTQDLVALLDHPNAWHRETAQRLLFERQDQAAVELLSELVKSGKTPQGRITAAWSLTAISSIQASDLKSLFVDTDHAKEQAMQMLAGVTPNFPLLAEAARAADSASSRVRFQAAFYFANFLGPVGMDIHPAYITLAERVGSDPWMLAAVQSSSIHSLNLLYALKQTDKPAPDILHIYSEVAKSLVIQDAHDGPRIAIGNALSVTKFNQEQKKLICRAIGSALVRLGPRMLEVIEGNTVPYTSWRTWLEKWREESALQLKNAKTLQARQDAIQDLSILAPFVSAASNLHPLLALSEPIELQLAALEALGSYREPAVADMLIDAWPKMTPALRDKATTILLSRTDRIAKLLDAIEAKKITRAQLSVAAKATLGRQKTPALAERIAKLIGDGSSSNRKEVIERYLTAMGIKERRLPAVGDGKMPSLLAGDPTRGAKIYETACMVCHKFADKGNDVGPHLGTIKAWTAEQLVTNILDPNREVSPNFALYLVETNDGRTLSGLITSETAGNLTLKRADGGTDTVLRSEIKSLTSPGISLMPEGLEAAITPQQMADLIAFLKAP